MSNRNINLKLDHHRQVVHPRPQTLQEESVAKPETRLLIKLSLVSKYDIKEVYGGQM